MQSLHPYFGGVLSAAEAARQSSNARRMNADGGEYWSEQPTPEGKAMLAAWQRSAAKHQKRAAHSTTPEEDYDMDYSSTRSPHRLDMDYDMGAYTSSSSPAPFDSSPLGAGAATVPGTFADLGLTGNETDEIYCQMLLQLNRENCHLKMQLRQAHRHVRQLAGEVEHLRKEHLTAHRHQQHTAAAARPPYPDGPDSPARFPASRPQRPPGWTMVFPESLAGGGQGAGVGVGVGARSEAEASVADSSMPSPSPSGSMLSSAGTRSDLGTEDRKAWSLPPGAGGGGGGGGQLGAAGSLGGVPAGEGGGGGGGGGGSVGGGSGGGGGGSESGGEKRKDGAGKAGGKRPQHWTDEEHQRFLEAMKIFGYSSAQDIARYVGTRSVTQVRTHTQKHFLKLCKGAPGLSA